MGAGVLYLMLLVFLLFQTVDDVRWLLGKVDPNLGKPLPERSYAVDCRIYTPEDPTSSFRNVRDCFYDEFVLAHFLGWFGKGLMLRDYWLCWLFSISFEILEVSLEHYLPNFAECWWDHILVDIFLCNYTGFWLGLKVCDYFRMKPLNWIAKVKPDVEQYKWEVFSNWKRLFAVLVLVFVFSMVELNAFFLKFVLWIPPPHPINVLRLLLWWAIG
jgi:phosphatidylserine synthase 2